MIRLTDDELAKWRAEIDLGVEFRDKEFGTYRKEQAGSAPTTTLAGRNLDYFERGGSDDFEPPLNVVYPIVKNIVPTLFYQNPRVNATPVKRSEAGADDAFYVSELLNQDLKDVDFKFKSTIQTTVFDSYVLGYGVVKVGYATEFGQDILPTEAEEKKKLKDKLKEGVDKLLEGIGLKQPKPEEDEPEKVNADSSIISERAYVQWISPFDFVIDPKARDITDARWVAQKIRRTLSEIKKDRRYGQAKHELVAEAVDDDRIPETFIEDFQTADCWEVHYKDLDSPTGIRVLTFAATMTQTKALMHDDSAYDIGGWQFEWLTLNKHGHRLYSVSTISIIRPLIDRINESFDAILEQVSKFRAKIAYNSRVTADGEMALDDPTIGNRVKIEGNEDVRGAIAVISMAQVNADMLSFVQRVFDFVVLIVGLTQAQLTGLSTANTATEAQIGQGGQNTRRSDEANLVGDFTNRVVAKLWKVKAQFQDFEDSDLSQESGMLDPVTGIQSVQWYPPIDSVRSTRIKSNKFKVNVEVSTMQKPNLEVVRQQFMDYVRILMEPAVTNGLAVEGKRLSPTEIMRQASQFFVEYGLTQGMSKMVVPVQDPALLQALKSYGQKPSANGGENLQATPKMSDLISSAAGEKGMGVPGA